MIITTIYTTGINITIVDDINDYYTNIKYNTTYYMIFVKRNVIARSSYNQPQITQLSIISKINRYVRNGQGGGIRYGERVGEERDR